MFFTKHMLPSQHETADLAERVSFLLCIYLKCVLYFLRDISGRWGGEGRGVMVLHFIFIPYHHHQQKI